MQQGESGGRSPPIPHSSWSAREGLAVNFDRLGDELIERSATGCQPRRQLGILAIEARIQATRNRIRRAGLSTDLPVARLIHPFEQFSCIEPID